MIPANDVNRNPHPSPPPPAGGGLGGGADGAASPNGAATLRDRVRSLRMAGGAAHGQGASTPALLLPWGLCVILAGVAAAFGYYAYAIAPAKAAAEVKARLDAQPADKDAKSATTAGATSADQVASSGDVTLTDKGYIMPVHQIQVSPKVSGMLVWIDPHLEEGQRFKEGDVLARIEKLPYEKDYDHALRAYASAQARTAQAKANLAAARHSLDEKQDDLVRDRQSVTATTASDLYHAEKDFANQKEAVNALDYAERAAEADETAAKADLEKAKWNLDNCDITAPVSGTVLKKSAEKGNIVNPIAFNISASLCDMADLSDLEVEVKVQERDVPKVKKGQPCVAMPEAYQNDPDFLQIHPKGYTGKVSRLMPTADLSVGAIPVRVRLDIPSEEEGVYLKPNMSIIVQFLKGSGK